METFFFYLIKASVCLVLFYLLYKFLLSRETFFRFNRYVLLSGIVICVLLPLVPLHTAEETVLQKPFIEIENRIISEKTNDIPFVESSVLPVGETVLEEENTFSQTKEENHFSLSAGTWFGLLYAIGFCINFILLTVSIVKMALLIRRGKKIQGEKYRIILTQKKICPFSFGKFIVLSEKDYRQNPDEIIRHEEVHAQMKHSLDIVFIEFFILLFWFNPVIWLLKRELQDVHEYEADNGVIQSGIDATKYQLLLIKKAVGARSYAIANSFNHSKIKNRITMMLKEKSRQPARLKTLLFIPLAAVGLHAFAHPEMIRVEESLKQSEGTTILQETQQAAENYFAEAEKVVTNVEDTVKVKKQKESVTFTPPIIKKDTTSVKEKKATVLFTPAIHNRIDTVPVRIESVKFGNQKDFIDEYEKTIKNGRILKSDTIKQRDKYYGGEFLYNQTVIVAEKGDTIKLTKPLEDEDGMYIKVMKTGNQKVKKKEKAISHSISKVFYVAKDE